MRLLVVNLLGIDEAFKVHLKVTVAWQATVIY